MQIGIDLGGSHVGVGIVNEKGKIVVKKEQDLIAKNIDEEETKQYIRDTIICNISEVLRTVGAPICLIDKIGIAVPGKVDNGIIKELFNLGIKQFNIVKELSEYYQVQVVAQNDGKCAGIAEKKFGALKDYSDAVFMCLGTGIGGVIFKEGKIVEGNRGVGTGIGHMIIQKDGIQCKCGNKGCFEKYCSMSAFKRNVIEKFNLNKEINSKEILEFVLNNLNDKDINMIIDTYIDDLILGITNIVNILDPEVICFGGGFVYFKDILFSRLVEKIETKLDAPKLVLGNLGNDAGMIGAVN